MTVADQASHGRPLRVSASFAISMLVHVLLALALALVMTSDRAPREPPLPITAGLVSDDPPDEPLPVEIAALDEQEFEQPALDDAIDPGEIAVGDVAEADLAVSEIDATAVGDVGDLAGLDLGGGLGREDDGPGADVGVTFFGVKSTGRSFVFVVDNSNSMINGRFQTALEELVKAVEALGPRQRFSVIFFSDTAYGLFHPKPFPGLVPATPANKEKLRAWLYTVEMCLRTQGEEAMRQALALEPDVINVLGDGVFGDRTVPLLTAPHARRTVINTFGMQVQPRGEKELTAIAKANRGRFHRVDVDPATLEAARRRPIRRNTSRGPVWGLKLPGPPP